MPKWTVCRVCYALFSLVVGWSSGAFAASVQTFYYELGPEFQNQVLKLDVVKIETHTLLVLHSTTPTVPNHFSLSWSKEFGPNELQNFVLPAPDRYESKDGPQENKVTSEASAFAKTLKESGVFLMRTEPGRLRLFNARIMAEVWPHLATHEIAEPPLSPGAHSRSYHFKTFGSFQDAKPRFYGASPGLGAMLISTFDVADDGRVFGSGTGVLIDSRYYHAENGVEWLLKPHIKWTLAHFGVDRLYRLSATDAATGEAMRALLLRKEASVQELKAPVLWPDELKPWLVARGLGLSTNVRPSSTLFLEPFLKTFDLEHRMEFELARIETRTTTNLNVSSADLEILARMLEMSPQPNVTTLIRAQQKRAIELLAQAAVTSSGSANQASTASRASRVEAALMAFVRRPDNTDSLRQLAKRKLDRLRRPTRLCEALFQFTE